MIYLDLQTSTVLIVASEAENSLLILYYNYTLYM